METKVITIQTYSFGELSENIQEKVLERFMDVNVEYEWYDFLHEEFSEDLEKVGLSGSEFSWELDRDRHFACQDLHVGDTSKFLKYAGWDLRKRESQEAIQEGLPLDKHYYGGGVIRNYFQGYPELTEVLNDLFQEFLARLQKEHEYLTSEKAVKETIEANEWEFLEDGLTTIHI